MTPEPLRRLIAVKPFEPFAIHMADRREFHIRHPEGAIISDRGRTIVVLNDERKLETLDILLVTSLRPLATSSIPEIES